MPSGSDSHASCLDPDETDAVFKERMEKAYGIASSSHAGHQKIRKTALFF